MHHLRKLRNGFRHSRRLFEVHSHCVCKTPLPIFGSIVGGGGKGALVGTLCTAQDFSLAELFDRCSGAKLFMHIFCHCCVMTEMLVDNDITIDHANGTVLGTNMGGRRESRSRVAK